MNTAFTVKYLFPLAGVGMLVAALALYDSSSAFIDRSVETTGTVERLVLSYSKQDDSTTYYPVVGFQTPDRQNYTFRSNYGSNPPSYSEGESVPVLYDPASPQDARIKSFFSLWGGAVILGGLGCLFGLAGGGWIFSD